MLIHGLFLILESLAVQSHQPRGLLHSADVMYLDRYRSDRFVIKNDHDMLLLVIRILGMNSRSNSIFRFIMIHEKILNAENKLLISKYQQPKLRISQPKLIQSQVGSFGVKLGTGATGILQQEGGENEELRDDLEVNR